MKLKTRKAQVVIAIFDSEKKDYLFLLLQTNQKRGAFWQNVTGKVDDHESFKEGALREATEETQLAVSNILDFIDLDLIFEFQDKRNRHATEHCFLMILNQPWKIIIDPQEHQNYKWISSLELNSKSVHFESNYNCLLKAKSYLTILRNK
jgi:8-oxo-dGTP pyrophosphatase MutT (NUDIX family)